MAVLKQISLPGMGSVWAISQPKVQIDNNGAAALSVSTANTEVSDELDPIYTIKLAVDGKTITGNASGLATALGLKVFEEEEQGGTVTKKARIALVDKDDKELSKSIPIEDIVGQGIVKEATYDPTTGILTIEWVGGNSDTKIDLSALLDIDDIIIKSNSTDYLSFETASTNPDKEQAQIGVKLAEVTYTATSVSTPANLAANTTNGKMLDASNTIPAIKGYVDDVLENASANIEVKAQGDDYVGANVESSDNKKVIVTTNVKDLTATAGSVGAYDNDGQQTTAPTNPTLTGVAKSLADASDIATKVKTYVDGAIAIEAARSDAKNKADIATLNSTDTAVTGQVVTVVSENKGIISPTRANLTGITLAGFATDTTTTGDIAGTDTVSVALNKLQNKVKGIQYKVDGTTLELFGITEKTN